LNNPKAQAHAEEIVTQAPLDQGIIVIIEKEKHKRSNAQNALSHMWYRELSEQVGTSRHYEKARCKLELGVPILRDEDSDFRMHYDRLVKPLAYEDKLTIMKDDEAGGLGFPVTSRMNVEQMTQYLKDIEHQAIGAGYYLTHPEDIYYQAMGEV
jgi:hypothetical protein